MRPRLALESITKHYGSFVANDRVSLTVAPGEIHAVLGENGAGKSTLMKIIYGAIRADAGEIFWEGRQVSIPSPGAARELGIGMVYQHFSLFETVSVVDNIALVNEGRFDRPALAVRIRELGEHYGLPVDPQRLVHDLSVGERQRVEILRCLLQKPKLLILDEPTSVLTPQAIGRLFGVLRSLAAEGCSILYISHKLEEIRQLCDGATILRGGKVVGSVKPAAASAAELAGMMVGAAVAPVTRPPAVTGAPRLAVRGLSLQPADPFGTALRDIELAVHAGEVVGIAGVSGNGQAELLDALSGEVACAADRIMLDGVPVAHLGAGARRQRGLAFVPEERLGRGAVPGMSLVENALLTGHRAGLVRRGFIDADRAAGFANRIIEGFGVRCSGARAVAASLSGGNLQKFIVGRERSLDPTVLIVSQPTWGVDVAAAAFLRQSFIDLSRQGAAVLVISEELEELLEICDRIAVLFRGRLSQALPREAISIDRLGLLMTGVDATAAVA
ncbi:MAG TPA: ABC transporter ATP-binding protein [Steroidobacteraceae bacterium]|nr:ABC transporter ATP-binding protein [Steroidobacteraceae bacterium]